MALHGDLISMLRESLPEYLEAAAFCAEYKKGREWGQGQMGGRLGYPAALLLFAVVDTIGSYHRGRTDTSIVVSGRTVKIQRDGFQHFYILNSEYYDQSLGEKEIKQLYDNFRSLLTHNAALAPLHWIVDAPGLLTLFPAVSSYPSVNIPAFLEKSKKAVQLFLGRAETLVPESQQAKNIALKGPRT